MSEWQAERRDIDRRSIITREARERMRRQSAHEQIAQLRREHESPPDIPDSDDSSINFLD